MIAIAIGTVAAFLVSGAYYAVVPLPASAAAAPKAWVQALVELLRSAVVAALVVGLYAATGRDGVAIGALLGAALWSLPVVLLVGAVVHEGATPRTAAVHAGDWLIKLLVLRAVAGLVA